MEIAELLHQESIIIDATCPLAAVEPYLDNYRAGGFTAIAATVGYGMKGVGNIPMTIRNIANWLERLRRKSDTLLHVKQYEDILRAKKENKMGVIFHFQGTTPLEDESKMVEVYYRLGARIGQLCYNEQDLVGCGCVVPDDTGLTEFGAKVIEEMNRVGMVVDCAHTGAKTTLDAIRLSQSPVIISHGNVKKVCASNRNLEDDLIKAIAENGGVVGINGFPAFVAKKEKPTLDDLIDHIDYLVNLVGIDHVCLGIDYFEHQAGVADQATADFVYKYLIDSGSWNTADYPAPPWYYPQGIEMPARFENMTIGLLKRGYGKEDVQKILGTNLLRIFKTVWK